jgi:hypothetical protein
MLVSILTVALGGFLFQQTSNAAGAMLQFGVGLALPLLALLLQWLAGRSIRQDEKLVRSADRLR